MYRSAQPAILGGGRNPICRGQRRPRLGPKSEPVKPTQKAVKTYYAALKTYADQGVDNESALRSAFQNLLDETGRRFGWTLIPKLAFPVNGRTVQPDGTFRNHYHIRRG